MLQQKLRSEQLVSGAATDLTYIKRSFFTRDVTTENICWTFELGVEKGIDVPIYVMVGFMQRRQLDLQTQSNDTIYRPTVSNA